MNTDFFSLHGGLFFESILGAARLFLDIFSILATPLNILYGILGLQ